MRVDVKVGEVHMKSNIGFVVTVKRDTGVFSDVPYAWSTENPIESS